MKNSKGQGLRNAKNGGKNVKEKMCFRVLSPFPFYVGLVVTKAMSATSKRRERCHGHQLASHAIS